MLITCSLHVLYMFLCCLFEFSCCCCRCCCCCCVVVVALSSLCYRGKAMGINVMSVHFDDCISLSIYMCVCVCVCDSEG